jgi:hypothetical protein
MLKDEFKDAVQSIRERYQDGFQGAFPYEDCRTVLRDEVDQYEEFVPDLNTYFYTIWSHCAAIEKVLRWPNERLLASKTFLNQTFFEKYPKYRVLEDRVTKVTTPRLYRRLQICDELRTDLSQLITRLLKDRLPPNL